MAGYGTGYPIYFICPVARRNRELWGHSDRSIAGRLPEGHDHIVRTGRTKPMPMNGKGHPRKLWTSHEFVCECGYKGWSSHIDILHKPLASEFGCINGTDRESCHHHRCQRLREAAA